MIIVSDTSPINYLVLIGEIEVLQKLAVQVIIPQAVYVDALLLDDRDGTKEVRKQNIPTLSTFGILEEAANKTLLDLSDRWTDCHARASIRLPMRSFRRRSKESKREKIEDEDDDDLSIPLFRVHHKSTCVKP
jgi:hypothetical protein